MRILIVGASGFIGRYVSRRLKETSAHDVYDAGRTRLSGDAITWQQVELTDITSLERAFQAARPDVALHLAAMADVGTAERERERATAINTTATASIARLCERQGARLVFVSTEYVFDGRRGYYREDNEPGPTTHYGQTKWEAERAVMELASRWSILRTSIVYGWPDPGKRNFAPWLIQRLLSGLSYQAPTNVYRSPIYLGDLADGISRLVEGEFPGIHHVAGRDWVSMYDFASGVARAFNLDEGLLIPIPSLTTGPAEAASRQDATRSCTGDFLGLDCAATMKSLGIAHPGLAEGIARLRADAPEEYRT